MMGNMELAPEVDVSILEPLLSPDVVSELLDTYMSTLTVSRVLHGPEPGCVGSLKSCLNRGQWAKEDGGKTCFDVHFLRMCGLCFWEIGS